MIIKQNNELKNQCNIRKADYRKRFISFLMVFMCLFTYSSFFNTSLAADVVVTGISLDVATLDLTASDAYEITAVITPADASNQNIIWTSSDNSVAVVDNGDVTAFSQGSAVITATTEDGSFAASCTVIVTSLTPLSTNETVRVKISMNNPTSVPFYLDGNYSIEESPSISLPRQYYEVKLESGVLNLYYGNTVLYSGTTLTLKQHQATSSNNFLWIKNALYGTRRYLGDMNFIISGTTIDLINHIYLEEYLWGVVPHEMSNSFPSEALKAQAVAARTYTIRSMGGTNYDLIDTSAAQVYKGYHPGNEEAMAAVDATNKVILQYSNTEIVPTYYSASNGGYTEIPYHTWGGGYNWPFYIEYDPYDIANPSSAYEEVFFPVNIDADNPVTSSDNVEGSPNINNAILYFKTKILESNQLQSAGYSVATVNDFELTGLINIVQHTHDSGGSEDHSRVPNTGINSCPDYIMATAEFKVSAQKDGIAGDFVVSGIELEMEYFDGANDDYTYKVYNMTGLRLTMIEPQYEADVLTGYSIFHRRYGHGIGMSQRGAQQRANSGHSYEQILSFYYPESGATILDIHKATLTSIDVSTDNSNATVRCNDYLSVRQEATTSSTRIFTLPPGARIEVVQEYYNSTFHMINFGDKNYFVHAGYVDIDEPTPVTAVSLNASEATIAKGNTHALTATITPADASNQSTTWTSGDQSVATVSESGTVTAHSSGTTLITVTTDDGEYTASCNANVIVAVTSVSLNPSIHRMLINDTLELTAEVLPSDATNTNVTYTSGNEAVATVNTNGVVTAHVTGTAVITVTAEDGSFTDTCQINASAELITSSVYSVNRALGYYEDMTIGTSVENIINSVDNALGEVFIFDNNMNPVFEGNVSTGYYIQLIIENEVSDILQIVIEGDCSPNTVLDIIDYTLIRLHILNVSHLEGIFLESADVNDDGNIDIIDYTLIRLHILEVSSLY